MPDLDLSIVIVSWNARDYLVGCLNSISETAKELSHEVIVVDNDSSDGSCEAVKEGAFENVRLVETGANLGFSKGNNIGIRLSQGRYFCLINSDVILEPDCLQQLLSFMDSNLKVGLGGPRLLNRDGTYQATTRLEPTLYTNFSRAIGTNTSASDSAYREEKTADVEVLAGSFWIARREAVEEVGLLDESFFFYGEDMDWCHRFREGGWRVAFFPKPVAYHFGGASSSVDFCRFNTELWRASLQHWEKYHNRASTLAYLAIGLLYHGLRLALRSLRLTLPGGDRASLVEKWKQHGAALRWLGKAFLRRLTQKVEPNRGSGQPDKKAKAVH